MDSPTEPPPSPGTPRVSCVIPCRNEEDYIETCVRCILDGEQPAGGLEVIVADGMSDDATREILARLSCEDPRARMIENPGRTVPYGLNAAIQAARGEIIVRIDAHTEYAPDYVVRCVETLDRTGADVVGGPWVARGKGHVGRAIAAAFRSPFGMGGARGHNPDYEGYLDTVYLGCWRKDRLVELGMFNDELTRNQDDELNLRIHRRGGKVYQSPAIRSTYTPRDSLARLFRQYSQYGFWKVRVIQKHRLPASVRHLVPVVFVLLIVVGGALSLLHWPIALAYAVFWGLYVLVSLGASVQAARRNGWSLLPVLPIVFFIFHFAYGLGFLRGIIHFVILRRGAKGTHESMSSLTR